MKTLDLIAQLAGELKPVKRQMSPALFAIRVGMGCLAIIGLSCLVFLKRGDFKISDIHFLIYILSSLGLMIASLLLTAWYTSPGRQQGQFFKMLVLVFVTLLFGINIFEVISLDPKAFSDGQDMRGVACFLTTLGFSIASGLVIAFVTFKRVVLKPALTGFIISLASIGAAGIGISLHCSIDNSLHIALWHFLVPIIVGSFFGLALGYYFLKWKSQKTPNHLKSHQYL